MGCCFSDDSDKTSQEGTPSERSPLLDPVSNAPRISTGEYDSVRPILPQLGDEQSALNRILHQTATNVIDVAAIDSHTVEQHEYMDRARQYNQRIAASSTSIINKLKKDCILTDIPAPDKVLAANPIPYSDIQMITSALEQVNQAVKEIKIEHKEDLVVQFGIP